jgi:hypothetical protein
LSFGEKKKKKLISRVHKKVEAKKESCKKYLNVGIKFSRKRLHQGLQLSRFKGCPEFRIGSSLRGH